MPPDILEAIRQVNHSLASALVRLSPERKHCSAISPQDFSDLLSEILRGAECLRQPSANSGIRAEFDPQLLEYRRHLESLSRFLPELHRNLLAEKSRLEIAQTGLAAAAAWAQASGKTL